MPCWMYPKVAKGKGGPPAVVPDSINVPLNHNGVGQKERPTTAEDFQVIRELGSVLAWTLWKRSAPFLASTP